MKYDFQLGPRAAVFFARCSSRDRQQLLDLFDYLAEFPHQEGQMRGRTPAGRSIEIKPFGRWVIGWWTDGADRQVNIVELRRG